MTHGVAFTDDHRHDRCRGRRTAPTTARARRAGLVGAFRTDRAGQRSR